MIAPTYEIFGLPSDDLVIGVQRKSGQKHHRLGLVFIHLVLTLLVSQLRLPLQYVLPALCRKWAAAAKRPPEATPGRLKA
jgi:hypothetical protein